MTTRAGRVIVVGAINADWVVHVREQPRPGETVIGGDLARRHGGKGANQAVAAARAGAGVSLVAAVGDDAVGDDELGALNAARVDCTAVRRRRATATGVAMITVDRRGENQIVVSPGANLTLTPAQVGESLSSLALEQRDVVLVSNEISADAVGAAIRAGEDAGARVILNPAPPRPLGPEASRVALMTPNRSEALALTQRDDIDQAALALVNATGASVVVTVGAAGAIIASPRSADLIRVAAPRGDPVDTVGAGDVFNGVLAAQLLAGADLHSAVREAVQRATESTRWLGARAPTERPTRSG